MSEASRRKRRAARAEWFSRFKVRPDSRRPIGPVTLLQHLQLKHINDMFKSLYGDVPKSLVYASNPLLGLDAWVPK